MDERGKASADGAWMLKGRGDNCQEKEREDGGMRDRLDGEEKRGAECLGDMTDSLAVRRGVMMADGNHSSDSPSLSTPAHTSY